MNAIRPLGRIVRSDQLPLYHDAASALASARIAAERLLSEAKQHTDDARTRAHAEGLATGQAEATRLLAETAAAVQRELCTMRAAIAGAIADGVAAVIGDFADHDRIARVAAHAVATLRDHGRVSVRVAPVHGEATRARLAHTAEFCRVIEDATLALDDCVVETEAGVIRAGIERQIATLRQTLLDAASNAA